MRGCSTLTIRRLDDLVLVCFACSAAACRTATGLDVVVPRSDWEVLFRPQSSPLYGISGSADGAIFAGGGRVYRAVPDNDYKTWSLISDSTWRVLDVFAFWRSSVALDDCSKLARENAQLPESTSARGTQA